MPLFADQWENGVAVRDAGCGVPRPALTVVASKPSRARYGRFLDGTSHRDAAAHVADEMASMPTAIDLVPEIEALA